MFNAFDVSLFQEAIYHFALCFLNSYDLLVNSESGLDVEISYNCTRESSNVKLTKYLFTYLFTYLNKFIYTCYNYFYSWYYNILVLHSLLSISTHVINSRITLFVTSK